MKPLTNEVRSETKPKFNSHPCELNVFHSGMMRLHEFRYSLNGTVIFWMFGCIILRRNGMIYDWCSNNFRLWWYGIEFTMRLTTANRQTELWIICYLCEYGLENVAG